MYPEEEEAFALYQQRHEPSLRRKGRLYYTKLQIETRP